jgi:hypothetical protein
MAPGSSSPEGSVISAVLRRIDRQVRINRVIEHLSVAVCLMLGALLAVKIVSMLLPVPVPTTLSVIGLAAALYAGFLVWSQIGARQLGRAAGVADRRGDLHDELKSAYWFMRQDRPAPQSEWVRTQVERAAVTAGGLDVKRLVPTVMPQRFWLALGMWALLIGLSFVALDGPLLSFSRSGADPNRLTAIQEDQFDEIRDLVERADELQADEVADEEQLSAEARRRLEEAMRQLEADEMTMEELLRELRETQNALDEGNLQTAALDEALQELARDMANSPEMADLAEALQSQDLAQAAELMRQLAESLRNMQGDEAQQLAEQLQQAAQGDPASMEELMRALQEAADAMANEQMADAEQALQEAADAMEGMSQRMDAQQMMNQASQQMQALQQSMEQQQMAATQMSQQMMAAEQSGGEPQEGAMAMPSDEVQKSAGGGETGDPASQEGGPAGHATSDPMGGEMPLGAPTTLEVQLEMEVLDKDEPLPEEEPDPEDLFQEASRQQTSTVEYQNVRGPSRYAEGSALAVEHIPWRYRNLVRRYFLAIRPRESK